MSSKRLREFYFSPPLRATKRHYKRAFATSSGIWSGNFQHHRTFSNAHGKSSYVPRKANPYRKTRVEDFREEIKRILDMMTKFERKIKTRKNLKQRERTHNQKAIKKLVPYLTPYELYQPSLMIERIEIVMETTRRRKRIG